MSPSPMLSFCLTFTAYSKITTVDTWICSHHFMANRWGNSG